MNKYFWKDEEKDIIRNTNLTLSEMMGLLPNRTYSGIRGQIKKLGLKLSAEAISRAHTFGQLGIKECDINNIFLDTNFLDIVNGNLLGDAWIDKNYNFGLANIEKDFVTYVNEELNRIFKSTSQISIKSPSEGEIDKKRFKRKTQYSMSKSCKPIFKKLYHEWYKNGKKIVPDNLELTPKCCYYWYIGDGCLRCNKKKSQISITIATNSFVEEDVEKLINKLRDKIEDFEASIHPHDRGSIIFIGSHSVLKFLNYIGNVDLKSFSYKWDLKGYSMQKTVCKSCDEEFIHYGFKRDYRTTCTKCRQGS